MGDRPPCSSVSRALGEDQTGTASRIRSWLLVEQPGPWGHDALTQSGFPPTVGEHLLRDAEPLGLRVLLIKRRDRAPGAPRRCFVAFTGRRDRRLATFEIREPAELLNLDLAALVRARTSGLGTDVSGPLFLVCTHGKHDACCARHGAPLFRALEAREDAWEASHVGGDRFAGNLVCFPHGMYFGRVAPSEAAGVADSYARGEIVLERFRGRCSYPPAVQAAEWHLRQGTGLVGVDDVVLAGHERDDDIHRVDFSAGGERYRVEIVESTSHERLLTCKARRAHRPRRFELRSVARVPVGGL